MCVFTMPVISVSATNIFAREAQDGRQHLVYSMTLSSAEDLAMILPLPVPPGSSDGAVEFVDLSGYPRFFEDLATGFPEPQPKPTSSPAPRSAPLAKVPLVVVEVGSFEASFVPTIADFDRLDPRFRLSGAIWSALPDYETFGFAVFKLKRGSKRIHPMAFSFPRANPGVLFFPTVHVHDGHVHPQADFDHALFGQWRDRSGVDARPPAVDWRRSTAPARFLVNMAKSRGLIDPDVHCYRRRIKGRAENRDIYVDV